MKTLFEGMLFADYFQIVIEDAHNADGPSEAYDDAATGRRRIVTTPHALHVFTARNMDSPVRVLWWDTRPEVDLAPFDHAVEASFSAPSGKIAIMGLTDYRSNATHAAVAAGPLRALALSKALAMLSEDELDGDDSYEVHLWSEALSEAAVLKAWDGRGALP